MLVLARRTNDRIILPTIQTTIQVVSIKSGIVRLGISAPDHVPVYRQELLFRPGESARQLHQSSQQAQASTELQQLSSRVGASVARLALARRLLEAGQTKAADVILQSIQTDLACVQCQMNQPQSAEPSRPPQALLVEHDHNERELLAGILRFAGVNVTAVSNGCEALNYLQSEQRPDVLLLDMPLPDIDTARTIQAIRQDPANSMLKIYAICQSALDIPDFETQAVDRLVVKPLNPESLLCDLLNLSLAS